MSSRGRCSVRVICTVPPPVTPAMQPRFYVSMTVSLIVSCVFPVPIRTGCDDWDRRMTSTVRSNASDRVQKSLVIICELHGDEEGPWTCKGSTPTNNRERRLDLVS